MNAWKSRAHSGCTSFMRISLLPDTGLPFHTPPSHPGPRSGQLAGSRSGLNNSRDVKDRFFFLLSLHRILNLFLSFSSATPRPSTSKDPFSRQLSTRALTGLRRETPARDAQIAWGFGPPRTPHTLSTRFRCRFLSSGFHHDHRRPHALHPSRDGEPLRPFIRHHTALR